MTNDNIFRLILLVCFAALLPFGLYHRIRSKTGEKLDRWQEGTFILFGLRLSGIPFLIGSLAWMINPQRMNTLQRPFQSRERCVEALMEPIAGAESTGEHSVNAS